MSVYQLLQQSQTLTNSPAVAQSPGVAPAGSNNPNSPPTQQTFVVEVNGVNAVSVTAQVFGSNDVFNSGGPVNWIAIGDPVTASGQNSAAASFTANTSYKQYSAGLSALTGTSALANVTMSA